MRYIVSARFILRIAISLSFSLTCSSVGYPLSFSSRLHQPFSRPTVKPRLLALLILLGPSLLYCLLLIYSDLMYSYDISVAAGINTDQLIQYNPGLNCALIQPGQKCVSRCVAQRDNSVTKT